MGRKNLLADTDFTRAMDNRFKGSVLCGFVSKLECNTKRASVRVIFPDRVDHEGTPLITKPVPILQIAAAGKKSYAVPRLNDMVAVMKMPNSTSDYFVLGSFYTPANPPPVSDPKLDYCIYDDGSTKQFDPSTGTETNKFKGDTNWDHQGGALLKFVKDAEIDSQGNITLKATKLIIQADIQHTGNMTTSGIHNAADGPHAACGAGERLEQANIAARIYELERKVARLEALLAQRGENL